MFPSVLATSATVNVASSGAAAAGAEKLANNDQSAFSSILYDNEYINELSAAASSAIESFVSMKPMFDLKPITNLNTNSNQTTYTHIFGFENLFESRDYVDSWAIWMKNNWKISIYVSFAYVFLVFFGKFLMRNRPKYELRVPLILWNLFLAVFSIVGTLRVWPDFLNTLSHKGIVYSVCDNSYAYGITGFWSFMFILSKLPELIDTFFIVLRKQELIFLHWYHHTTVLVYCWFSYKDYAASGRWFMSMNYLVHSLMYSYYAFKAMRFKVPRFISQIITTGQIVQMIAGCYVNYVAWQTKTANQKCSITDENIKYSSLMYFSYFALFFDFFIKAYILNKKKSLAKAQTGLDKNNNPSSSQITKLPGKKFN